MTTHSPPPLSHAPAIFDELQTSLCFPFPGVNSRAELVPSHGASRRWLGDQILYLEGYEERAVSGLYISVNYSISNVGFSVNIFC